MAAAELKKLRLRLRLRGTGIIYAPAGDSFFPAVLPIKTGGPAAQSLTQASRFDNTNALNFQQAASTSITLTQSVTYSAADSLTYQHSISQAFPQTLTQSVRFDNANSLAFAHTLLATITLTQSTSYNDPDSLAYQHSLDQSQLLSQTIRFDNSPSFLAHTITVGLVSLTQTSRFDNTAQFFAHTVQAYIQLVAGLFEDSPTPPTPMPTVQLDLTTGRLSYRVNPQILLLL